PMRLAKSLPYKDLGRYPRPARRAGREVALRSRANPTRLSLRPGSSVHEPSTQTADLALQESRILVIDDEPRNILLLERALEAAGLGHVIATTDPCDALRLSRDCAPDLIVLDLHMPGIDGP